jgi:hypothetical protein
MTNHDVIYGFRLGTKHSRRNLIKFLEGNLNCIRFYLTRVTIEIFKVITHERWPLTSFLRLGSLVIILVNFP